MDGKHEETKKMMKDILDMILSKNPDFRKKIDVLKWLNWESAKVPVWNN